MANTIKHKRGSGSNPSASDLAVGELAIRTDTGVVFTKKDDGSVAEVAGGVANNSDQSESIGLGPNALDSETSGTENTALGSTAGTDVTTGTSNVFVGRASGRSVTTGGSNVIVGHDAGQEMETRSNCVILGRQAGQETNANSQILIGYNAGRKASGEGNIVIGHEALSDETGTPERITCIGFESLYNGEGDVDDNTSVGYQTLKNNATGASNTAIGSYASLKQTGGTTTAVGMSAGRQMTSGTSNVYLGWYAAFGASSGATASQNTYLGAMSGYSASSGGTNTAVGYQSLYTNTTGAGNVALGHSALRSSTTASNNVAIGYTSQYSTSTGTMNVSIGHATLEDNTTGNSNVVAGHESLKANTTGFENSVLGNRALKSNTSGYRNVAIGAGTLEDNTTAANNTGVGYDCLKNCTGSENTAIGSEAGDALTSGSNNIIIGNGADASSQTVSNELTIGNSSINSLRIPGLQSGASDGQVLTYSSSNGNITLADASSGSVDKISEGNTEAEVVDTGSDGHFKVTTEGTERLRVNSSGRVGIGTDSPEEILHIAAASETVGSRDGVLIQSTSSAAADTGLPIVFTGDIGGGFTNYGLASIAGRKETGTVNGSDAAGYLQFATSSTGGSVSEVMRIDSSGHVGIGTTPNDVDSIGRALNIASSTGGAIYLQDTDSLTGKFAAISYNGSTARLQIHAHHSSSFIDLGTNGTERMRIDSSGNVGIGTSSPGVNLDVASSTNAVIRILGDKDNASGEPGSARLRLDNDGGDNGYYLLNSNASGNPGSLEIGMNNSGSDVPRITIDNSGRVGLGTSSPSVELSIAGSDPQLCIWEGSDGDSSSKVQLGTGTTQGFVNIQKGDGTRTVQINSDGNSFFNGGNVGIGASNNSSYDSAAQNLLVADESSNAGITIRSGGGTPFGAIHFADGTSSNAEKRAGRILYGHDGDFMSFSTVNSEAIRIDSSGNVGIGTSSPGSYSSFASNLVVNEAGNAGISISSTDSDSNFSSIQFTGGTTRRHYIECGNGSNGNFTFQTGGTGSFRFIDGSGERVRIDGSGNVGIGTSSPSQLLDINGNCTISSLGDITGRTFTSSDQYISNRSGTSNCFVVQSGGSNTAVIKANGDVETDGSILAERIRLTGAIYENDQNISADYSITSGSNAMSAGPITIDSGVTVTVTSGCTWTVV